MKAPEVLSPATAPLPAGTAAGSGRQPTRTTDDAAFGQALRQRQQDGIRQQGTPQKGNQEPAAAAPPPASGSDSLREPRDAALNGAARKLPGATSRQAVVQGEGISLGEEPGAERHGGDMPLPTRGSPSRQAQGQTTEDAHPAHDPMRQPPADVARLQQRAGNVDVDETGALPLTDDVPGKEAAAPPRAADDQPEVAPMPWMPSLTETTLAAPARMAGAPSSLPAMAAGLGEVRLQKDAPSPAGRGIVQPSAREGKHWHKAESAEGTDVLPEREVLSYGGGTARGRMMEMMATWAASKPNGGPLPQAEHITGISFSRQSFLPPAMMQPLPPVSEAAIAPGASWQNASRQVLGALQEAGLPRFLAELANGPGRSGPKVLRQLRIQLQPAGLGTVAAQLTRTGQELHITIHVPHRHMAEQLRKDVEQLVQRIQAHEQSAARAVVHIISDAGSLATAGMERVPHPHAAQPGAGQSAAQGFAAHAGAGGDSQAASGQQRHSPGQPSPRNEDRQDARETASTQGAAADGAVYL